MSLDEDWLDDELLADDTSDRYWRKKSTFPFTRSEAMGAVPRWGQVNTKMPMDEWRLVKAHADAHKMTLQDYTRRALARLLVSEGVDPSELLVMWRNE